MRVLDFKRILPSLALIFFFLISLSGQDTLYDCKIELKVDVLSFKNSQINVEFNWNNGDIRLVKMANLKTDHTWELPDGSDENSSVPDSLTPVSAGLNVYRIVDHVLYPDHLVGEITAKYKYYDIKRTYRLYPDIGALPMSLSLKKSSGYSLDDEQYFDDKIILPGRQWKIKSIEFFDRTDHNNNLVSPLESLAFLKPLDLRGNLLIATDLINNESLFVIKEAPLGESQLLYPGFDFQVKWGELTIKNLGALYSEVPSDIWFRCYGYVLGTGGKTDHETLIAIRTYMKNIRKHNDGNEEMIMMNTWGDRGQDGKINEDFALNEIKKGKKLGITHFQLDDGWQQGLSKNSKTTTGKLWDQWKREDWEPHHLRFPSGLGPVLDAASKSGIEMGLWFHPSNADSYSFWQDDADIIMDLYDTWGIKTFKIDGIELNDKNADIHMRNIFETVALRSNGAITFNVDATAGRRGGYFYLNEYGNIFLENRYTDWGNYYPHWTLRNLWQLSEYVPPEMLQIEFLNNTRNNQMYDAMDPLRPSVIPFDYVFSITMAGQPLAWFESSGLPEEAYHINSLIESYKKVMSEFHQGYIFPIGEMPDGGSWTGFQSILNEHSGYFLIYRENNSNESFEIQTYLSPDSGVKLEKILGYGDNFDCLTGRNGEISFNLSGEFTYGLFHYVVEPE
ncbi:MAG TPA: alpha-galactosidase [Bacteroides sp.]|nr:alpha-galactosidase [Bacteroides sp.]